MKQFIIKSIVFIGVISLYFSINYGINRLLISSNPPKINATTLIMGDSQIMTSLDPNKFNNAINIAQNAEPYLISYLKLRELLKYNHFDTVIIGFSFQNLSELNNVKLSERFWSDELFDRAYSIAQFSDYSEYQINYMSLAKSWVKNLLILPKKKHDLYIGRFVPQRGNIDKSSKKLDLLIKRHFNLEGKETRVASTSIQYLDSIIKISKHNKIKLILVNTPVHNSYLTHIPSKFVTEFRKFEQKLRMNGLMIIDLSKYSLPDNSFRDFNHVNEDGATVVTSEVIVAIKKHQ